VPVRFPRVSSSPFLALTLVLLFGSKIRARVVRDESVSSSTGTVVGGSSGSSTMAHRAAEDQKDIEITRLREELAKYKKGKS
jgi:hypothetical protein